MNGNKFCIFTALLLPGFSVALSAADLKVGPGHGYSRIEEAVAAAKPGDVVLVHPQETPYTKINVMVFQPGITIRAVVPEGEHIRLNGEGFDYSGAGRVPRAIFQINKGADGFVIEGFDLSGAHNNTHNAAGIRINQANNVTIRNCVIHKNDMGIMSNGDGTLTTGVNQLIENCVIHSNGSPDDPGYNHNLYLGGTSVTVRGCEIHSSLTGHNIKSRAHITTVTGCYVHDSANRELDLVDDKSYTTIHGSNAVITGNVIVKAANCRGNRGVIHFGQDGGNEHNGVLFLARNTIVTPYVSPVIQLSTANARAQMLNNILWDGDSGQKNQVLFSVDKYSVNKPAITGTGNLFSAGFHNSELGIFSFP